jgi:hypothetical protein
MGQKLPSDREVKSNFLRARYQSLTCTILPPRPRIEPTRSGCPSLGLRAVVMRIR